MSEKKDLPAPPWLCSSPKISYTVWLAGSAGQPCANIQRGSPADQSQVTVDHGNDLDVDFVTTGQTDVSAVDVSEFGASVHTYTVIMRHFPISHHLDFSPATQHNYFSHETVCTLSRTKVIGL